MTSWHTRRFWLGSRDSGDSGILFCFFHLHSSLSFLVLYVRWHVDNICDYTHLAVRASGISLLIMWGFIGKTENVWWRTPWLWPIKLFLQTSQWLQRPPDRHVRLHRLDMQAIVNTSTVNPVKDPDVPLNHPWGLLDSLEPFPRTPRECDVSFAGKPGTPGSLSIIARTKYFREMTGPWRTLKDSHHYCNNYQDLCRS